MYPPSTDPRALNRQVQTLAPLIYLIKSSAIEDPRPTSFDSAKSSTLGGRSPCSTPPSLRSAVESSWAAGQILVLSIEKKNYDQASDPDDSVVVCSRMVWEARGINQLTSFLHRGLRARPRILRTRPSLLPPPPPLSLCLINNHGTFLLLQHLRGHVAAPARATRFHPRPIHSDGLQERPPKKEKEREERVRNFTPAHTAGGGSAAETKAFSDGSTRGNPKLTCMGAPLGFESKLMLHFVTLGLSARMFLTSLSI